MRIDYTASGLVFRKSLDSFEILLIFHNKLDCWITPGGHIEPDETPADAAKREVLEETGYCVELIDIMPGVSQSRFSVSKLPTPAFIFDELVPEHGAEPEHRHIDMIYLCNIVGGEKSPRLSEVQAIKWFSFDDLDALDLLDVTAWCIDNFHETLRKINYL